MKKNRRKVYVREMHNPLKLDRLSPKSIGGLEIADSELMSCSK